MSSPQASQAEEKLNTFWCCLYVVEEQGTRSLVYGYAVSAQEPSTQWASSQVWECAAWRIKRVNCFLTEQDLRILVEQFQTGRLRLSAKSDDVEIESEGLCRRPSVFAVPRTLISHGSPRSLSEDPAIVDAFWRISKRALINKIFPESRFADDQVRESTRILFRELQSQTGISFLNEEAGRFGNFEIIRYLSGDIRSPDGLCCLNSYSDMSLVVWIEPPLDGKGELSVNCRLFNGGWAQGRTCILDELRKWTPGTRLRFSPSEPYSEFVLSVWCNGKIIAYQNYTVIRSASVNLTASGQTRRIATKWSRQFQGKLRERAERIQLDTTQQMIIKSPQDDPWRTSEAEASAIVESWFPQGSQGRFFVNASGSTLEAVEFLAELIRQPRVVRATIVDPFFDRIGVESLLSRLGDAKDVKVLTSHSLGGGATVDGTIDLTAACELCRETLPIKLEVINIESPGGNTQQFHDRYIVIESENEQLVPNKEVWMLSNSLSSMAVRYPLLIVPLTPKVASQVANYISSLESLQVAGRSDMQSRVVWTNNRQTIPQNVVSGSRRSREFSGWELILEVLVPDQIPDEEKARIAVTNGLLTEHIPAFDWHVPPEAIQQVVGIVKTQLSRDPENRDALLTAVSHWAYHGGPSATDYGFDADEIVWIRDVLRSHLTSWVLTNHTTYEFSPLRDSISLPECLEHVWYLINQAPLDVRNGATPELFFYAEALWASAPEFIVQLLDATRSFALFCWVATEGYTRSESVAMRLLDSQLGAVQALGTLFLRNIVENEAATTENNRLTILAAKLASSGLLPFERLLAMIFISARYVRPGISEPAPFAACVSLWSSQPLSQDERNRLSALVDRAAPNRVVPMIGLLANACPLLTDGVELRQWCIEQIKAILPLKPVISPQQEIRVIGDEITLSKAAEAAWHVHGAETPSWFCHEVINKIDYWTVLEPLLRVREYTRWNEAMEGVLRSMSFGIALANAAPSEPEQAGFVNIAAANMAKVLGRLGSEVWHHFGDFNGRLKDVVVFLGRSTDMLSGSDVERIEKIVADQTVPSAWRLLLVLQSPILVRKFRVQALTMVTNPTTPAGCRNLAEIEEWAESIVAAAGRLEEAHEDLRESLSQIKREIGQWKDGFLPPTSK